MTRPEAALIDELEFRSYVHNRKTFPEVSPERWAAIFSNVPEMEEQYLDMLSTGNILDVAPQGENDSRSECSLYQALNTGKGVTESSPVNLLARGRGAVPSDSHVLDVADRGNATSVRIGSLCVGDEGGGEILSSSPLYLLASEIVDKVTKGYEQ